MYAILAIKITITIARLPAASHVDSYRMEAVTAFVARTAEQEPRAFARIIQIP